MTYNEPPTPQGTPKPQMESLAIHTLCIHHQNHNFGTTDQIDAIKITIENMQIPQYYVQQTPPTSPNTIVYKNNKWNKISYPPHKNLRNVYIPTLPNFEVNTTLKIPPQYSYYTDGSFMPPKKARD